MIRFCKMSVHQRRFWIFLLIFQIILFFIFSKIKKCVDFFEWFFVKTQKIKTFWIAKLGFSVGDFIYFFFGLFLFSVVMVGIFKAGKRKKMSLLLLKTFNIFYFVYQLVWGMLYFQKPILVQFKKDEITTDEVKKLALKYLKLCRETRKEVHEDEKGVFKITNLEKIKFDILRKQKIIAQNYHHQAVEVMAMKPSLYSFVMNDTGILGYYNPFTSESQYNQYEIATNLPFTMAHEMAHQIGFAREQEANFIGYFIGYDSPNVELKYSTEYFVLESLLIYLIGKDDAFIDSVLSQFSDGMKRDFEAEKKHMLEHRGLLSHFFGVTNNLFLKSNQQDGIITYSYFVDLLVLYERNN